MSHVDCLCSMKISTMLPSRILQSPAAYVPLDPETPGLLSARVMTRCHLQYCAVKTDILQVEYFRLYYYVNVKD